MSTQVVTHETRPKHRVRPTLIWVSWTGVVGTAAYFFFTSIPNYFHYDVQHYRHYWPQRWWLIAHIGGGSVALATGLFQFSTTLRKRFVTVHRWMGRLYLSGVLVGSLAAVYIGIWVSPQKSFGMSLEGLALAWILTSGMAYIAVMRRQFAAHREWMIRSYVVTFAFVWFRLGYRTQIFLQFGAQMRSVMLGWACWAIPLLIVDVALGWRNAIGNRRRGQG